MRFELTLRPQEKGVGGSLIQGDASWNYIRFSLVRHSLSYSTYRHKRFIAMPGFPFLDSFHNGGPDAPGVLNRMKVRFWI